MDTVARDVESWAFMPAFGERRLAVGLPISMVPLHKYRAGARQTTCIFEVNSAKTAHALAIKYGIDYLYVGTPERRAHPLALVRFDAAPQFFEPVFRNREAVVYRVRR